MCNNKTENQCLVSHGGAIILVFRLTFFKLSLDFTGHQRLRQNFIETRGSYSHYNYYLITLLLDTRLPKIRSVRTRARLYICLNTCVIKNRAVSEIHCLNK